MISAVPRSNCMMVECTGSSSSFLISSILEGGTLSLTANWATALLRGSVCKWKSDHYIVLLRKVTSKVDRIPLATMILHSDNDIVISVKTSYWKHWDFVHVHFPAKFQWDFSATFSGLRFGWTAFLFILRGNDYNVIIIIAVVSLGGIVTEVWDIFKSFGC